MSLGRNDEPRAEILRRISQLAPSSGEIGPAEILLALAYGDDPTSAMLKALVISERLRGDTVASEVGHADSYFNDAALQIWNSARQWAAVDKRPLSPEYLLVRACAAGRSCCGRAMCEG